jgi:hypothetical protein
MYALPGFSAQRITPLPEWPLTISIMLNAGVQRTAKGSPMSRELTFPVFDGDSHGA